MSVRPLYIFDLDGTLALIDHRRHHVQCPPEQQNWQAFNTQCTYDAPHWPVIKIMQDLITSGAEIWIFSGRSASVRQETVDWLGRYAALTLPADSPALNMRPVGNTTADVDLKKEWLGSMLPCDRDRLVAVFEDRARMVDMWRAEGLTCLQVAPGDF